MLFSSMTFIYAFLPLLIGIYFVSNKRYRNTILLIASIIFYAWGEPKFLLIMLASIFLNWAGAILIDKFSLNTTLKKICLWTTISLNLGILVFFKYFNFIIENYNLIFNAHFDFIKIALPLGISFYTFQALSYVIDVYRGACKVQKNLYKVALFICLFPQLVAGPIIKYHDIEEQIDSRKESFDNFTFGVKRFIIGLSKKMLIANTMAVIADKIFIQDPHSISHFVAWLGAIAYSLQIFFDFSGYSDMAIGLGLIFGFKFLENFNYPYISKSITEFWRRWHMSLSGWFKQYVYIPLGGNKYGKLLQVRNLGIVFLLTGIWHGAAWNFILWGLWNGCFIIFEKLVGFAQNQDNQYKNIFMHIYCILVFVCGWVIFRADNLTYAWRYLCNMFGILKVSTNDVLYLLPYYIDRFELLIFIVAIICCMPIFKNILGINNKIAKACINAWLILLFIFSTAAIAADTYNPFIYFRF